MRRQRQDGRPLWRTAVHAAVVASATLLCAAPASGQADTRRIERAVRLADESYRIRVDTSLGLTERSMFDVGGFVSMTGVWLDDADDNSRRLFRPELTLYGRAIVDGAHRAFVRARFRYSAYSEGDSFDDRGDRWNEPFLERWWYEFDLASLVAAYEGRASDFNFNIRLGRQFIDWGTGLVLSEGLYAARPTLSFGGGAVELEGLIGITPGDESVVDFDASRQGYNEDTERGFFGGLLRWTTESDQQLYAYVIHMEDYNGDSVSRVDLGVPVDFEYDATYVGIGVDLALLSRLRFDAEFVYQFGDSASDPLRGVQTREDVSAWAGRARFQYLFTGPASAVLEFETLLASGDDDRLVSTDTVGGNLAGTKDTGFNSLGFVNTGLSFAPSLSNLMIFRAGVRAFPFHEVEPLERLQLGVDLFLHTKMDANAPIEEPTNDDRYLGFEADLLLNWRVMSDLTITARYGVFFPGEAITSEKDARHFVFLGCTLAF